MPQAEIKLSAENYSRGFLIDEELMAGVSPAANDGYLAYVLCHATGEYLGQQRFSELTEALAAINRIPRTWAFEAAGGCGGGKCGEGGSCPGKCRSLGAESSGCASSGSCPL